MRLSPPAMTVDNGDPHNVSASDPAAAAPGQDQPVESEVSTAVVPEPPASLANKRPVSNGSVLNLAVNFVARESA